MSSEMRRRHRPAAPRRRPGGRERVVDLLEVVDVEQDQRQRAGRTAGRARTRGPAPRRTGAGWRARSASSVTACCSTTRCRRAFSIATPACTARPDSVSTSSSEHARSSGSTTVTQPEQVRARARSAPPASPAATPRDARLLRWPAPRPRGRARPATTDRQVGARAARRADAVPARWPRRARRRTAAAGRRGPGWPAPPVSSTASSSARRSWVAASVSP